MEDEITLTISRADGDGLIEFLRRRSSTLGRAETRGHDQETLDQIEREEEIIGRIWKALNLALEPT